jgi:hypothetical protein
MAAALKERQEAKTNAHDASLDPEPWLRQPGESVQAYARFLVYRDQPADSRSQRKVGVSNTLAFRWAKRWRWTARVDAWDSHLLAAIDNLGLRSQLRVRSRQLDVGLAFAAAGESAVKQTDLTKVGPDAAIALAESGVRLARQAVGLAERSEAKQNGTSPVGVAVNVVGDARVGFAPSWLRAPEAEPTAPVLVAAQPQTKQKEAGDATRVLVDRIEQSKTQTKRERNE